MYAPGTYCSDTGALPENLSALFCVTSSPSSDVSPDSGPEDAYKSSSDPYGCAGYHQANPVPVTADSLCNYNWGPATPTNEKSCWTADEEGVPPEYREKFLEGCRQFGYE